MRVLTLLSSFLPDYTGGAEISAYHTCRGLIQAGITCTVLIVNNRTNVQDEWYELDGILVHRVGLLTPIRTRLTDVFDWRVYRIVRKELRRLKPDLVHVHNVSGATLAPYLACRSLGIPVLNTLHDVWLLCPNNMLYRQNGTLCDPKGRPGTCQACFRRRDFWGAIPYRRAVFAALTANVRIFISPSQAVIDRHVEAGYPSHRFRLVRLGFEERRGHTADLEWYPSTSEFSGVDKTIAFAGGSVEIKGAYVLLRAIPMMMRYIAGLKVLLAGKGEERFLAQCREYAPSVRLLGRVSPEEMRSLFAAADLTLVPSLCHENSPAVIFESYQAGTPVVGSRMGGIPELIREGETGYLCPANDAAALAEKAILHFSRPACERRHMRHSCVREVRGHLAFDRHIEGILQVYQEAVAG